MSDVTLYSTGCPKCHVLKKKLDQSTLSYQIVDDVDVIRDSGFTEVPILVTYTGGTISHLTYKDAVKFVNRYIEK